MRTVLAAGFVVVAAALATACGGDEDALPAATSTPRPTPTPARPFTVGLTSPALPEARPAVGIEPLATSTGTEFEIAIVIAGAEDLARFEIELSFDPAVIDVFANDGSEMLAASPRGEAVQCLTPASEPGRVRLHCLTLGNTVCLDGEPGANGDGTLATMTVRPVATGETSLSFEQASLVDDGEPCAGTPESGTTTPATVDAQVMVRPPE